MVHEESSFQLPPDMLLEIEKEIENSDISYEDFKEIKRRILLEMEAKLLECKKQLINDQIRKEKQKVIANLPDDVKTEPFINFLLGMKNKYAGKTIIVKKKKVGPIKKPSVKVMIEDQTVIFDGSSIKIEGGNNEKMNEKFFKMVQNAYGKCFGDKK